MPVVDSTGSMSTFDKIEIMTPGDSPSIFQPWTKCEISIRYRNEEKLL